MWSVLSKGAESEATEVRETETLAIEKKKSLHLTEGARQRLIRGLGEDSTSYTQKIKNMYLCKKNSFMKKKSIPVLKEGHYWYYSKESFNVNNGCICFTMYTITKTWRHVNSEGWEKYHNEIDLNCILQFEKTDELFLSVSTIYKCLSEKNKWATTEIETFLDKFESYHFSVHEEKDIMDDCY